MFCDYTSKIFGVPYAIDLIPIPMGDVCLIVGMHWLRRFRVMINFERLLVVFRIPSGGETTIYGEVIKVGSPFRLVGRARKYLQHGCLVYLAYVVDT